LHFCLKDHIVTGNAKIDIALSDKRRDIRGRKKNKSDGVVQDEAYVQSVVSSKLNVGT